MISVMTINKIYMYKFTVRVLFVRRATGQITTSQTKPTTEKPTYSIVIVQYLQHKHDLISLHVFIHFLLDLVSIHRKTKTRKKLTE